MTDAEQQAAVTGETSEVASNPGETSDRRSQLLRGGALLVATVVLATGLFAWWRAGQVEPNPLGAARDTALIAARSHIQTMNTLDHRKIDQGLAAWAAITTGVLHDQILGIGEEEKELLVDQQAVTTSKVVDAAVLDATATTATVIASVETTVSDQKTPGAEPTVKRNRFSADLVRVGGKWKLENLQQVQVNLS